jgi:hypothetical protein
MLMKVWKSAGPPFLLLTKPDPQCANGKELWGELRVRIPQLFRRLLLAWHVAFVLNTVAVFDGLASLAFVWATTYGALSPFQELDRLTR